MFQLLTVILLNILYTITETKESPFFLISFWGPGIEPQAHTGYFFNYCFLRNEDSKSKKKNNNNISFQKGNKKGQREKKSTRGLSQVMTTVLPESG